MYCYLLFTKIVRWTETKISKSVNPSRSDFKYPSDFGFQKSAGFCRIQMRIRNPSHPYYCVINMQNMKAHRTTPFGLKAPGHSGFLASNAKISSSCGASTWPFHGRFMRCGETRTHWSVSGLYRLCWCSVHQSQLPSTLIRDMS